MNFSVLDWNIEGSKYYTSTSLDKVAPSLEKSPADIFCIQEAQELKEKLNNFSWLRGFNAVFPKDKNNRNIILSRFSVVSSGELIFPQLAKTSLENALWADIKIGAEIIRIYNCHFEIVGVGPKQRADQLKFVLADSRQYLGPVIICGDLNTTIPAAGLGRKVIQWFHKEEDKDLILDGKFLDSDERYALASLAEQAGFHEATDISKSTWSIMPLRWEIFNLKLDWFFVRDLKAPKTCLGEYISDHRSIYANFSNT